MLRIRNRSLSDEAKDELDDLQKRISNLGALEDRITEGKRLFKARNKESNRTFAQVRRTLRRMSRGPNRCMYCEDSSADQIDHFQPKDFYPEAVFCWHNYIWSCGRCNKRKSNEFYVLTARTHTLTRITRVKNQPFAAPPRGRPVFLNARKENPLDYMQLDLRDTFNFVAIAAIGTEQFERVRLTIKVLGLNERDDVVQARRNAFGNYAARLEQYINRRDNGASANLLGRLRNSLLRLDHPTVWEEMKRQFRAIPTIRRLFQTAPEALTW